MGIDIIACELVSLGAKQMYVYNHYQSQRNNNGHTEGHCHSQEKEEGRHGHTRAFHELNALTSHGVHNGAAVFSPTSESWCTENVCPQQVFIVHQMQLRIVTSRNHHHVVLHLKHSSYLGNFVSTLKTWFCLMW